jgi:hypothetical protein
MHAHARVHACAHHSSTTSQGCVRVHYMGDCVCCYYFANSSLSVCLYMYVRVFPSVRNRTEEGKHNSTPTQAHTSWYSPHLCHILERVGRHRRDTLIPKIQCTTFRGAGARAHERRTGEVAAEGAAAKGHCPRYRRARDGAFVPRQLPPLLGTDRCALQLVLGQIKCAVSRRNRELGNQLSCILRKAKQKKNYLHTHTHIHALCMFVCMIV